VIWVNLLQSFVGVVGVVVIDITFSVVATMQDACENGIGS
jgi:hypothetical protein